MDSLMSAIHYFSDKNNCEKHLINLRWKDGIKCPFCRRGNPYVFNHAKGYKCSNNKCYKKFNIKTRSIFENTKIPLNKWFIAIYLHSAHKKGISSYQLSRDIEVTQKTAWFMLQRIRVMMVQPDLKFEEGVAMDETFVGGKNKNRHKDKKVKGNQGRSFKDKTPVLGMYDLKERKIYMEVIPNTEILTIQPILFDKVKAGKTLYSDEWKAYNDLQDIYEHGRVNHQGKQFCDGKATTNQVENVWSHLKRGIIGLYHHVSRKHLQLYCNEFTFRFNSRDMEPSVRFDSAFEGVDNRVRYCDMIAA